MADRFPTYPGSKGAGVTRDTSEAAAAAIAPDANSLRKIALRTLARLRFATPLECCEAAGVAREALQPRLSELRRMGLVEATGIRSRNPSGRSAAVLTLTPAGWEAANR